MALVTAASSGIGQAIAASSAGPGARLASDIADAATFIVTRGAEVAINEILIRPSTQV